MAFSSTSSSLILESRRRPSTRSTRSASNRLSLRSSTSPTLVCLDRLPCTVRALVAHSCVSTLDCAITPHSTGVPFQPVPTGRIPPGFQGLPTRMPNNSRRTGNKQPFKRTARNQRKSKKQQFQATVQAELASHATSKVYTTLRSSP